MAGSTVAPSAAEQVAGILDSPEVSALVRELDELRWTGRKGYGSRTLVGAALVKSIYALTTGRGRLASSLSMTLCAKRSAARRASGPATASR